MFTKKDKESKRTGLLIFIALISLALLAFMVASNLNQNEIVAKADEYDFEIYFLLDGQSQVDLGDDLSSKVQFDSYLLIEMYIKALSAPSYDLAVMDGTMYLDKNYFTLPDKTSIDISVSTTTQQQTTPPFGTVELSNWSNHWMVEYEGYDDCIRIGYTVNPNLPGNNVVIDQNGLLVSQMWLQIDPNNLPTEPTQITWDFDDSYDPGKACFAKYLGGIDYHHYCTMNEGYLVDDSNILFSPLYFGDPPGTEPTANLTALSLKDNQGGLTEYINPSFSTETTNYTTWQIPYADSVNGMILNYTKESSSAIVDVSFSEGSSASIDSNNIITGLVDSDEIYIDVSAEEGALQKRYTIIADVKAASSNTNLSNISAQSGGASLSFEETFHEDTLSYTLNIPYSRTEVTLSATSADSLSEITIDGKSVTNRTFSGIGVGTITKDIVVTAEDLSTKTYSITITRAPASQEIGLDSILVNGNSVEIIDGVNNFNYTLSESTTNYVFTIIGIEPTLQKTEYQFEGSGTGYITMPNGSNSGSPRSIAKNESAHINIRVTAQDVSVIEYYTLTITRAPSTNTDLYSVTVQEGDTTKTLQAQGEEYTYTIAATGANSILVTATGAMAENATVRILNDSMNEVLDGIINIQNLMPDTYYYTIEVTPQDVNVSPKNYTLKIIKKSDQKELFTPEVFHTNNFDEQIEGFTYNNVTFTYTLVVDYALSGVVVNDIRVTFRASEFSAITSPAWANLNIGAIISGQPSAYADISFNNSVSSVSISRDIIITAQDGSVQNYTMKITRNAANTDNKLSSLMVGGSSVDGFDSNIFNYNTPTIFPGETQSVNVYGQANSEYATITYNDSTSGQISLTRGELTIVSIKVIAQSGSTQIYTLRVIAANTDNSITNINLFDTQSNLINGLSFDPQETGPYNISVPNTLSVIRIEAQTPSNALSIVYGQGTHTLNVSANTFIVYAVSEAGVKGLEYTIVVTRNTARTEKILSSLTVSSAGANPVPNYITNFNSNNREYDIRVNRNIASLKVQATIPANNGSSITSGLTDNYTWTGVNTTIQVEVTAEDGSKQVYRVEVTRANDINAITSIQTDVQEISYNAETFLYELNPINYSKQTINLSVTLEDSYSKLYTKVNTGTTMLQNNPESFDVQLNAGNNSICIYVTSEYGTQGQKYKLNITRNAPSANAKLDTLEIIAVGNNLLVEDKAFDSDTFSYELRVDNTITSISINAQAEDENAQVSISPGRTLSKGLNTFHIYVTAQNGADTNDYEVRIIRANDVNDITDIAVNTEEISFNPLVLSYVLNQVEYSTPTIVFSVVLADTSATVYAKVNSGAYAIQNDTESISVNLVTGANTISIYAKSEYGTQGSPYVFSVTRTVAGDNAKLGSLEILANSINIMSGDSEFNPDKTLYEMRVNNDINSVTINASPSDSKASLSIAPASRTLNIGINTFYFTVTAEDGNTQLGYEVRITKANDINDINIISVDLEDVEFNSETYSYALQPVAFSKQTAIFSVILADTSATVYAKVNSGAYAIQNDTESISVNLVTGTNTISIYAKSEYGTVGQPYIFTVIRNQASSNALLSSLEILDDNNQNLLVDENAFYEETTLYELRVDNTVASVSINYTKADEKANVTIMPIGRNLSDVLTTFHIIVTAEDNVTQQEYQVKITRANDNNEISNISVNIEPITFDKETADYSLSEVAFSIKSISFNVTVEDSFAELYVKVNNSSAQMQYDAESIGVTLQNGENNIKIYAVSEYGTQGKIYTFTITQKAAGTDNSLSSLVVLASGNNLLTDFDPSHTLYDLRVDNNITQVDINAVATDINATVTKNPSSGTLQSGKTTYYITVTAESGDSNNYILNIYRANDNNTIMDIKVNGVSINLILGTPVVIPAFHHSTQNIIISVTLADNTATVYGAGTKNLVEGVQLFEIYAISQYGLLNNVKKEDVDVYVIQVTRNSLSNDNKLEELVITDIDDNVLPFNDDRVFNPLYYNYGITLEDTSTITKIKINVTAQNNNKTLSGDFGTQNLTINGDGTINSQFIVTVTAENGSMQNYIINVVKGTTLSNDASISAVTLKDFNNIEYMAFNSSIAKQDDVHLPYSIGSLTLIVTPNNNNANVTGTYGNINIQEGGNVYVVFKVVAQDGTESLAYNFTIYRAAARKDNDLETLAVKNYSDTNVNYLQNIFNASITTYEIRVDDNVERVIIEATLPENNGSTIVNSVLPSYQLISGQILTIFIMVGAENGDTNIYTLNIKRANNDNSIMAFRIGQNVIPVEDFSLIASAYEYTFSPNLIYSIKTIEIEAILLNGSQSKATVTGDGIKNLSVGSNSFIIYATAQDGTVGSNYVIRIIKDSASNDAELSSLKVTANTEEILLDVQSEVQTIYNLQTDRSVTDVIIVAPKRHEGATVMGDIGSVELSGGTVNVLKIYVTAENNTTKTYTINIDVKDDDNQILDITADCAQLSYDNQTYTYNLEAVSYNTEQITFGFELSSQYAKLYVNSAIVTQISSVVRNLNQGNNTFVVYALSERGTIGQAYTINIIRTLPDSNNYLSSLTVSASGSILPFNEGAFNKEILEYTIVLDSVSTITYVEIEAVAENGSQPQGTGIKQLKEIAGVISNVFVVAVTAENASIRNYSVTVIKSESQTISDDNQIKDISLIGKGQEYLKEVFDAQNAVQDEITVSCDVDSVYLSITAHEKATVSGAGLYSLDEGQTITIEFHVTAESGMAGTLYQINVTREISSSNNTLIELYYEIEGVKSYLDTSIDYHNINVDYEITAIIIGGQAPEYSTVIGFGEFNLPNTITTRIITVKAQNGDLQNYAINIAKQSDDATIKSILLDGVEILNDVVNYEYQMNMPYSQNSINIVALPNNVNAVIHGNGNYDLSAGENIIETYAVSEAGTQGQIYTIVINRQIPNDNNNLATLVVIDTATEQELSLQPGFSSNTTKYTIDVTNLPEVQEILIQATAESVKVQSVVGIGTFILRTEAGQTSEMFSVTVTAEDNSAKKYDITVIRNVNPDNDVTIHSLSFIGNDTINYLGTAENAVQKFELNKKSYSVVIPYRVDNMTLTITNNNGANVYGNGNYVLSFQNENIIEFYLDSRSGLYSSGMYVIVVTRQQPSSQNQLSSLAIDGTVIEGFDPEITSYEMVVSYEQVSSVEITAIALDLQASVIGDLGVINLSAGLNTINVTVKAEDNSTKTYSIIINSLSSDNTLLYLGVTDCSITPTFDKDTLNYSLQVPYTVEMVNIEASANAKATIAGTGHIALQIGENTRNVIVTSEMGESGQTYVVVITRLAPSSDSTLKSLTVLSGTDGESLLLQPAFNSEITDYIIQLEETSGINMIDIYAEANCPYAKGVGGTGYKVLTTTVDGKYNNIFEIIVMAQDDSTKVYTVSVYRNVELSDDITITRFSLIGSDGVNYLGNEDALARFLPNTYSYNIVVPYFVESITLAVNILSATIYGAGQKMFDEQNRVTFNMYLVSQSGSVTSNNYTIVVNRILPLNDNQLKWIKVNGQDLEGFIPEESQYELIIPYQTTDRIIITAEPNSPSSIILNGTGSYALQEGRNVFSILVRAESGDTKSYNLVVNYMNNNSYLQSLSVQGSLEDYIDEDSLVPYPFTFIPDTFNYIVTVDKNIKTVAIEGAAHDQEKAAIIGLGQYSLNDDRTTITLNVIAADNVTTSTYKIDIVKTVIPSTNSRLKELQVGGYSLGFRPDNYSYMLNVGTGIDTLDINAIPEDPNAKATIIGNDYIDIGKNVILVQVESEDGHVSYYQLCVRKNTEPDYFLTVMLILIFLVLLVFFLYKVLIMQKTKGKSLSARKEFKGFKLPSKNNNESLDLNNIGKETKKWQI